MPPAIPVVIAAAIGAGLGAVGVFTAFAIAGSFALAGAVTFGGLALAQYLLTPKPPTFDIGTVRADTRASLRVAVSSARWVLGRARLGSVLAYYFEPEGNDREAYLVLTICEGPIEGIERIWIDGVEIPWNDGITDHTAGAEGDIIKEFARVTSSGDYDGSLFMTFFYNGAERLDEKFPKPSGTSGFTDNQWTEDHKLTGKVVALIQLYQPSYGNDASSRVWNRLPSMEFLVKGQKISYPGVSVPTWTENAAAIRYWFLTKRRGLPSIAIHPQDFIYAFQVCGEIIRSKLPAAYSEYSDSGQRYTINGVLYSDDDHETVEAEMDFAWAGYAIEINGSYRFRPGLDRPISITIGPEDIIERGTDVAAPALSDRINAGTMRIAQSCSHDFTKLALPEFKDDEAILRDGGKLLKDFRVRPFISCPVAGGRLLAVMLRRARANKVYSRQITPGDRFERLHLIPTDRIILNDPEYGLDNVPVVITARTMNEDWSININFEEAPDHIYSTSLILPPLYPNALTPINVLRGPNIPTNVVVYAEAILTEDYTVHSVIHVSWDESPHRTRIVVEFVDITKITMFRDEKLVSGTNADFMVPYEGVYRVTVWHVDIRNVLSRPYFQDIVIDWTGLDIIPLEIRVNEFIDENESFKHLTAEAELANAAADRAAKAALLSEDAATASEGSATASAGSAALSEQDAEVSAEGSLAAAQSAMAAAAQASNAMGSATAASQSALTASAEAGKAGTKAAAASVDAVTATTDAAKATASATRAAASATTATGSTAAALVSQTAAAGSAADAQSAVAGITSRVATAVDSALGTTFAAAVVLRARAGTAGAQLELVALSDLSGSRSLAKIRADMFRVGSEFSVDANGNLIAKNIRADHISADVQNVVVLWTGTRAVGSTNKAFVLPQNINIFSVIEVYWESTHNSGGAANATGVLGVPVSEIDGAHAMNHRIDRSAGGGVAIIPSYSGKTLNLKNTVGVQFTAKAILGIKNPSGTTAAPDPVTTDPVDPVDPGSPTAVSANAGPNVSVESGDSVSIGGTDSVTSGVGTTTFSWARRSGTGGSLNNSRTAQPTFTAPTVSSNRTIVWRKTTTNNGVSDSDDVTITVTPAATQAPGAPSTPRATEREETSLTLATTPGAGGAATGYRWRISTNSAVTNADAIHTSSGPSITITGLNSNDDYWADVRAENSTGNSAYSGNLATSTTAGTTTDPVDPVGATTVTANAGSSGFTGAGGSFKIGGVDTIVNPVGPTTIRWTLITGGGGTLDDSSIASPTFTFTAFPLPDSPPSQGTAVYRKGVTNNGVTGTADVTIRYIPSRGTRGTGFDVSWVSTVTLVESLVHLEIDSPAIIGDNYVSLIKIFPTGSSTAGDISVDFLSDLTDALRGTLTVSVTYDGVTLTSTKSGADTSSPYSWSPKDAAAWATIAQNMVDNLGTASITVSA